MEEAGREVWQRLPTIGLALILTVVITLVNLGLRWLRWHFLTRRVGVELDTKDSLLIYMITLPAMLTPFYVGELFRAVLVGRKWPGHRSDVVAIWFVERCSDLAVIAFFLALARGDLRFFLAFSALWLVLVGGLRVRYRSRKRRTFPDALALTGVLATTVVAWLLPALALWLAVGLLGQPLGFTPAVGVFSHSTILGGLAGLPAGVGVTGSSMISKLGAEGVPIGAAILATATWRAGTTWLTVAWGLFSVLLLRRRALAFWRSPRAADHFDEIAGEYAEQIPSHVRDRLLGRKLGVMQRWLDERGAGQELRGLDIGCGQGWYACEMASLGYRMWAVDQSVRQVAAARHYAEYQDGSPRFGAADATALPFSDGFFDFAYSVNMVHHVIEPESRERVLREIVRVLKPGGVFVLHEVNITNPLFRFYMGYVFPLIREIDEGTEKWILPGRLPPVPGTHWLPEIAYFTFLPDFLPQALSLRLVPFERRLERSRLRTWSAHFAAQLVKDAPSDRVPSTSSHP